MKDKSWMESLKKRFTRDVCVTLTKAFLFAMLPVMACAIACAAQGGGIGSVYLPASRWNDELFYYKQVEGMLRFGYPYGYFGFNESRAAALSFAAWSPLLVLPWLLFGMIAGWGLLSPIVCNILLLSLAMFAFVLLTKPDFRQLGLLTMLFLLFTPFARYMLSGMPEITCFSLLIVFYGLAVNYLRNKKCRSLALLFAVSVLLTLMRPYMALFLLLPCFLWTRRNGWRGAAGSAAVLGASAAAYILIGKYLCSTYFTPLFDTSWAGVFAERGFMAGVKHLAGELLAQGRVFFTNTVEGFRSGWVTGAICAGFFVLLLLLLAQTAADIRKKRPEQALLHGHLAFCFLGMLGALLLMYNKLGMEPGSKHLLAFMAVGLFAVGLMETKFCRKAVLVAAVFAWLYVVKASDPYTYEIPMASAELEERQTYWEAAFSDGIELNREEKPGYSNVIIWTFEDETEKGTVLFDWQILYALPEGFGISCCRQEYVLEHFGELKSRYVAAPAGGKVDRACREAGFAELGRSGGAVFYARY